MVEYRFLALTNQLNHYYISDWYPIGDGEDMNMRYWELNNICHDINIEIREVKERSESFE